MQCTCFDWLRLSCLITPNYHADVKTLLLEEVKEYLDTRLIQLLYSNSKNVESNFIVLIVHKLFTKTVCI